MGGKLKNINTKRGSSQGQKYLQKYGEGSEGKNIDKQEGKKISTNKDRGGKGKNIDKKKRRKYLQNRGGR